MKRIRRNKKNNKNRRKKNPGDFSKLSLFQKFGRGSFRQCPLSGKNAPVIDYKNVKLLKKYMSENGKIMPSRITSVCQKKQRELATSIKRARNLALI